MARRVARRGSPEIEILDYRYGNYRCKDPITQSRRTGNKTRVTVSSAQDAYHNTGVAYVPDSHALRRREDHRSHDYRRARPRRSSSSSSRDSGRRRTRSDSGSNNRHRETHTRHNNRRDYRSRSRGSFDPDDASSLEPLEFEFDVSETMGLAGNPQSSSDTLEHPLDSRHKAGNAPPVAGPTTDLHLAASRWLGNTFDNWDVGAELTPAAPNLRPSISWHHLERAMPTFDEFIAVARRELQHVPERNLRRVEAMLRKIQKENEKQRQYGREMVPVCVSDAEYQNEGRDSTQNFAACFSAFPFFSLEKLAESRLRSSASNAAVHPTRPLLQTYSRTVNDKRELSQVIATRPTTPKGYSLHVSTVWCLVVDEHTILTCSKLGLEELRKDFTSLQTRHHPATARTVRIKAGNSRSWLFPADEVRSWPSLLAMFANDLSAIGDRDARAKFTHQGRIVNAQMWTKITARASNYPIELMLQDGDNDAGSGLRSKLQMVKDAFRPRNATPVPRAGGFAAADASRGGAEKEASTADTKGEIISHLRSVPTLNVFLRDSRMLKRPISDLADALHDALSSHPQKKTLQAYESGREATLRDVQTAISKGMPVSGRRGADHRAYYLSNGKFTRIALLAEYIFAFFWPVDCDHIMTRRFWGAVHTLLDNESFRDVETNDARRDAEVALRKAEKARRDAEMAAVFYDVLYHRVFAVASALTTSLAGGDDLPITSFPSQFYEAWLHIATAFALLADSKLKDTGRRAGQLQVEQLEAAAAKLQAGEEELVGRLREFEVEDYEVCSSRGLVALMFNSLSQDTVRAEPGVAQTYGDYCLQLDAMILENPLTRAHQANLRALQQELEAVLNTLTSQLDVVAVFERSIQAQDDHQRMPYLGPLLDSRQDAVLETCKNALAARIDQFKALQARATELAEWHLGEIDNNKDKQEAAIMVFTIVTIVFLPLSFVSSVLGMNTSDIRDLPHGQWVYWVVAVPLTVVVIAASLYWAGSLGDWELWSSKDGNSKEYRTLAAETPVRIAAMTRRQAVDEQCGERPRRRTTFPARDVGRHYV